MVRNLRVMHVITELGTYGAERFLLELLPELPRPALSIAVLLVSSAASPVELSNVEVFPVGRRGRYDVAFLGRMSAAIRSWKPDIVHSHGHHGKYWGRLAALGAGVPHVVHTEHNSEFESRFPFTLLNRALHARTARFVALSTTHGSALASAERIAPDRITVIANGIRVPAFDDGARDRARTALGLHDDTFVVIQVGRLATVKNQRLSVQALARLPGELRDRTRLFFVGEGADRTMLQALAVSLGIADRITFLGYRDDVAALLPGADAWLMTSLNEGMPISLIEAMAAGVPIVSTPWSGATAILEGGWLGRIAANYTPDAVASELAATLGDPAGAGAIAAHARVRAVTAFSIENTAQQYAALYRSLVA